MQLGSLSKLYSGTSLVKAAYVGSNRFYRNISAQSAVNGFVPGLCFDFVKDAYATDSRPATFGDSITHSASTNGTMVDSDGLLKWRPHNLLLRSEEFDNASWTKASVNVTANATAAPDGATVADKVVVDAGQSNGSIYQSVDFAAGANVVAQFDISNGTFVQNVSGAFSSYQIHDAGNGWFKISVVYFGKTSVAWFKAGEWDRVSIQGFQGSIRYYPKDSVATTGDGTSGIYLWGAHLYRSDIGGMVNNPDRGDSYVPTTSAARYLARRGHHIYNGTSWVNEGLLVESTAATNLLPYSNDFSVVDWLKANQTTVASAAGVSPDGTNNAWRISTTSSAETYIFDPISWTTGQGVISAFVKAGTSNVAWLFYGTGAANGLAYFDLSDQTTQAVAGTSQTPESLKIVDVGSGWFRISARWTTVATVTNAGIGFSDAKGSLAVTSGTNILAYGAQAEQGSTPSSYIPTSGATVTRAAETLTIPSAKLPWPSPNVIGPELVTNGTFDTDLTGWTLSSNSTPTWVGGTMQLNSDGATFSDADQSFTTTVGATYVLSVSQVNISGDTTIHVGTTQGDSQLLSEVISSIGTAVYTFKATDTTTWLRLRDGSSVSTQQIDNISVREIDPLAVSIQMQGRMTYADNNATEATLLKWDAGSGNNIYNYLMTFGASTGFVRFAQSQSGTGDQVDNESAGPAQYSPGINVPFNIASRHGSTFINGAVDGTALTANTTPKALPDLSATDLNLGFDYMGTIKLFRIWADDLTDAGIEEATT